MIICPNCGQELDQCNGALHCRNCKYTPVYWERIVLFHPEIVETTNYNASGLDTLIRYESKHFWLRARRALILRLFNKYITHDQKIIEVGAGTGSVAGMLAANSYTDISAGEIYIKGLHYASTNGITKLFQFDILRTPFKNHFDAVGIFDVLEHFEDDVLALRNIYDMLKEKGTVIATVPAYQWLWSQDDTMAGHKRRYSHGSIKTLFSKCGFEIMEIRGFFISILPLLIIRKIIHGDRATDKNRAITIDCFKLNPVLNTILYYISQFENIILSKTKTPIGGSISIVARKPKDSL